MRSGFNEGDEFREVEDGEQQELLDFRTHT
jgi:hypothetical protein